MQIRDNGTDFVLEEYNGNNVNIMICSNTDNIPSQEQIEELANNHYSVKRINEYPSMLEYIDAQVKKASADTEVIQQGMEQELAYKEACLAVKAKYISI